MYRHRKDDVMKKRSHTVGAGQNARHVVHLSYRIAILLFFLTAGTIYQYNAAGAETVEVTASFSDTKYKADEIQSYLNMARDNPDDVYKITIPAGTYLLGNYGLHIYSNTHLSMEGVTIKRTSITKIGAMMTIGYALRETKEYGVWQKANGRGYYWGKYKRGSNIIISGGTFDAGTRVNDVSTLFSFSHVEKLTFENVTFRYKPKSMTNKHMIEFAAAKNINIIECTFDGNNNCGEAVQIESAIAGVGNYPCKGPADGTQTKNITLQNNYFKNFQYCVGTNHGISKDVYKTIVIQNNIFERVSKYAICTYNYVDCSISGNVVKKSGKHSFEHFVLKLGSKNSLKLKNNDVK